MHPLAQLILDPTAGPAGVNVVSILFYLTAAGCILGTLATYPTKRL